MAFFSVFYWSVCRYQAPYTIIIHEIIICHHCGSRRYCFLQESRPPATIINGSINLSGLSSDGQEIVLSLAGVSAGTYPLGPASASRVIWWDSTMFMQNFSTLQGNNRQSQGQVVVADIDKSHQTISGTFHCSLYSDSAGYAITVADGFVPLRRQGLS